MSWLQHQLFWTSLRSQYKFFYTVSLRPHDTSVFTFPNNKQADRCCRMRAISCVHFSCGSLQKFGKVWTQFLIIIYKPSVLWTPQLQRRHHTLHHKHSEWKIRLQTFFLMDFRTYSTTHSERPACIMTCIKNVRVCVCVNVQATEWRSSTWRLGDQIHEGGSSLLCGSQHQNHDVQRPAHWEVLGVRTRFRLSGLWVTLHHITCYPGCVRTTYL